MSHMKNEAQQEAVSAHGNKDLQYALGFSIHGIKTVHRNIWAHLNVLNMLVSGILVV